MATTSLDHRVFMHSYPGFNSTSTLFYGERDAILIDATQLLSDAHRLAAELIEMGKRLTHIYVSHFHPDHHFGCGVLKSAFPRARVVALPSVVQDIVFTTNDKVDMWGDFFGANEPETVLFPMPLTEPRLEVEGHTLQFSDDWEGDSANNSVVYVPSLNLACATDVAYLDCHIWMVESNAARREEWRASLRQLLAGRRPGGRAGRARWRTARGRQEDAVLPLRALKRRRRVGGHSVRPPRSLSLAAGDVVEHSSALNDTFTLSLYVNPWFRFGAAGTGQKEPLGAR